MDLSIVIVNYNVKHFLQQCLQSVFDACKNIDAEVFVVDNKSVDGSVEMVKKHFPQVNLIVNQENTGFSRANNVAVRQSKGEYVLLLNPDTVVQEDTFEKCLITARNNPNIGGLGVKMIDGSGAYLPESKRGLPSPWTAFYKMLGLSSLFPKSKKFGRYYLGHLSSEENNPIEILSGAFMFMKKSCLDKVGLLDEDFFMYGEDIDLSFRILKGGYENYYLADTSIIHYKGESTKKGSLNYVKVFYQAMILYAQKHFTGQHARFFILLIKLAVYLKALLALLVNFLKSFWKPLAEFALLSFSFYWALQIYQDYSTKVFPEKVVSYAPYLEAIAIVFSLAIAGAYKEASGLRKLLKGNLMALLGIGFLYSMLPESLRFSRLLVFALPAIAFIILAFERKLIDLLGLSRYFQNAKLNILVLGANPSADKIVDRLKNRQRSDTVMQWDLPLINGSKELRKVEIELSERVRINRVDEIIFLNDSIKNEYIINLMSLKFSREVQYKIIPRETDFVIGSGSKDARGELRYLEPEPLFSLVASRKKRWGDMLLCALCMVLFPYLIFKNNLFKLLANCWSVFFGKKHWVGLNPEFTKTLVDNNAFKGVIPLASKELDQQSILRLNRNYCNNYNWYTDFNLFCRNLNQLDA